MGTRLIFLGHEVVTDLDCSSSLSDWKGCLEVPGNSPSIRSYPKPTQVDR